MHFEGDVIPPRCEFCWQEMTLRQYPGYSQWVCPEHPDIETGVSNSTASFGDE